MTDSRQAGRSIRDLAVRRRVKAITSFMSAGMVLIVPLVANRALQQFLSQLQQLTPASAVPGIPAVSPLIYGLLVVVIVLTAISLVWNGLYWWRRANQADQGAQGEEALAALLIPLQQVGWQFQYNLPLGNRLGDADIVCRSPQGRVYVIDVKSHRGEVHSDGKQVWRQNGSQRYAFPKDLIGQVMKQALQVKKQLGLSFVTPILAFSAAQVVIPRHKVGAVYVVDGTRLLPLLESLG